MVASVSLRALPPRKTTGLREFVYGSRSRTNALHKPLQRRGSRKAQPALAEEQTKSEEINEVELARELKGASVVLEMLAEFFWIFLTPRHLPFVSSIAIGLELQGRVDDGSYAAVFKAVSLGNFGDAESAGDSWQGEAGRVFAVKILQTMSAESIRDFRREALLLGRVDHPGIIAMYQFGKIPQPFMVSILSVWDGLSCF